MAGLEQVDGKILGLISKPALLLIIRPRLDIVGGIEQCTFKEIDEIGTGRLG